MDVNAYTLNDVVHEEVVSEGVQDHVDDTKVVSFIIMMSYNILD